MEVDMTAVLQTLTELRERSRREREIWQRLHERSRQRLMELEQLELSQRLDDIERRLTRLEERAKD